jgi:hypothetical protein
MRGKDVQIDYLKRFFLKHFLKKSNHVEQSFQ